MITSSFPSHPPAASRSAMYHWLFFFFCDDDSSVTATAMVLYRSSTWVTRPKLDARPLASFDRINDEEEEVQWLGEDIKE